MTVVVSRGGSGTEATRSLMLPSSSLPSRSNIQPQISPVDNLWALTTEEWKGRVAIPDPLLRNETMFWFNQLATHEDAAMREAYKAQFGEELTTDEASATAEWVKRLARNQPKVTRSDTDVGPIVGAKEEKPPIGFLSVAIFRDAKKDGYGMGICKEMKPWIGQLTPRVAVIAAGPDGKADTVDGLRAAETLAQPVDRQGGVVRRPCVGKCHGDGPPPSQRRIRFVRFSTL